MAAKKSTKHSREVSDRVDADATNDSQVGDVDQQIEELRRKIRALEERKAAAEFERTALYKNLKAAKAALDKAVADMDARASMLDTAFIRASRQYLSLLDRALEQARGKKRRGRKPKSDFA
ncbi:MAG: hypothetical protein H6832_10490 [Planctomycetes bacterium]|nr:hypothetical protein [Planctomycetota bacterium]